MTRKLEKEALACSLLLKMLYLDLVLRSSQIAIRQEAHHLQSHSTQDRTPECWVLSVYYGGGD